MSGARKSAEKSKERRRGRDRRVQKNGVDTHVRTHPAIPSSAQGEGVRAKKTECTCH